MSKAQGYKETEVIIHSGHANWFSFLTFVIALFIYGVPFILLTDLHTFLSGWKKFLSDYICLSITLLSGMLLHELLHAVCWSCFAPRGFRSIEFGINWKQLAPFVHCKDYLKLSHYALGVALPGMLLGILPAILSLTITSDWLLCFATFFTAGAAGDFASLLGLRKFQSSDQVLDHPDHLGFFVRSSIGASLRSK